MDLNGDGDKSKVVVNRRETDFSDNFEFLLALIRTDHILDGKKQILINDSFIESSTSGVMEVLNLLQ